MKKIILKWEAIGGVIVIISGSLLHFTYLWSGKNKVVAAFSAVNESTWEHLKLAFWPSFVLAVIGYFVVGKNIKNFCYAKALELYLAPLLIISLFYGYTAILGYNLLPFDIGIFVFAVILAKAASYKVQVSRFSSFLPNMVYIIMSLTLAAAFIYFTYDPPWNFLFLDPVNGNYGIEKSIFF